MNSDMDLINEMFDTDYGDNIGINKDEAYYVAKRPGRRRACRRPSGRSARLPGDTARPRRACPPRSAPPSRAGRRIGTCRRPPVCSPSSRLRTRRREMESI